MRSNTFQLSTLRFCHLIKIVAALWFLFVVHGADSCAQSNYRPVDSSRRQGTQFEDGHQSNIRPERANRTTATVVRSNQLRQVRIGGDGFSDNQTSQRDSVGIGEPPPRRIPRAVPLRKDDNVVQAVATESVPEPKRSDLDPVFKMLDRKPTSLQDRTFRESEIAAAESTMSGRLSNLGASEGRRTDVDSSENAVSAKKTRAGETLKFRSIIDKLAYNTIFVLTLGIGFIVVAKFWSKRKPISTNTPERTDFQIKATFKVTNKSKLMLMEVAGERLVVASDPTGIKSVVKLSESFASKFASAQEEEEGENADQDSFEEPTYSMNSIRKSREKSIAPLSSQMEQSSTQEDLQQEMEAALLKFGLKDLLLDQMQSKR